MALEGHGGQHGAALRGRLLLAPICLHGDPTVPSSPCPGLCLTLIQRTALLPQLRRPRRLWPPPSSPHPHSRVFRKRCSQRGSPLTWKTSAGLLGLPLHNLGFGPTEAQAQLPLTDSRMELVTF